MIKKLLQPSNWKKTYYYLKKNGLKAAFYAAFKLFLDNQFFAAQIAENGIFFNILTALWADTLVA